MRTRISRFATRRAFTVVTLAFLSITLLLGWEVLALRKALEWVDHTDEVIGADGELLRLNIDMETGVRGFLLTEDETFLQPYKEADGLMELRFDGLNRLVADNSAQQNRLARIHGMYTDWLRETNAGVTGTRSPGFFAENSSLRVQLLRKAAMDRIRAAHLAFASAEGDLRKQRLDTVSDGRALVNVLLLLVSFLGGAAALLALKNSKGLAVEQSLESVGSLEADRDGKEEPAREEAVSRGDWRLWMRSGALAAGLPLIALLLSLPLRAFNPNPFVLFFAAVSIVTWMEGLWWGFLALAISTAFVADFLIPPFGSFVIGFNGALGLVLSGCIQLLICWMIDNQKQAANTLRDQASLLDLSHDCIMVRELGGQIRFWNHGAEEMYGYSREEVGGAISHHLLRTVFPRPRAEIEAELLRNGRWEGELKQIIQDGSHIVVDSRWVLQDARKGGTTRVLETNKDITERSLQEEALRKSEAFLEQTGRLAGFGGWDVDIATNTVIWAAETYHILGADPSYRPTLQEALDLYTPAFRPVIAAAIEKASAGGEGWDLEASLIGVDGRAIWARVVGSVEFVNGHPVRLVGVFQDITSRVAERQALEDANARTALATDSCGIGIWDWKLESGTFSCDTIMYQLYGLKPECEKLLDLAFWAGRVHPEDRVAVEQALQDCIDGIRPYDAEFRTVWDDGNTHHIKATGKVICEQDGKVVRMVGTNMDITARKLEEAERTRVGTKLRAVVDHAVDGLITIDVRGNVESFNPACERIFGYESEEVIGKNIKMLMPDPYHSEHDGYLSNYAATGHARIIGTAGREVSGRRKDGSVFPMDLSVCAFELEDGRHYSGIVRDIAERKSVEVEREKSAAELVRYTRALERSNQELDAFAYAASHDLKAPLRVIHNASTWLEEDLAGHLTAEMHENMSLLRSRVRRMDRLLDDLLEYSRIGHETENGHSETISGAALIENIIALLAPPEGFIVDASSTLAGIAVYRMPLQQILINLISNAIKHHDKTAGRIEVSVKDLGANFCFIVKDDGPGIPAQYHEQIFKMFQTLKPRDQVEGSGMGLAMVRKHIDVAGGELKLESAIGQGSTFRFTWPKDKTSMNNTKRKFARIGEAL